MKGPRDDPAPILIGLTGDVMIGRLVEETLQFKEPAYIWGNTLSLLQSADFNLVNLEAALTRSTHEVPKVFNFKACPERAEALRLAPVHAANLANNHSLDYGLEGLEETLKVLDQAEILHAGAGNNIAEAKKPVITTVKGIKIGIIGCTDNEPSWIATARRPGTRYIEIAPSGLREIENEVKDLRGKVDLVILTIHWGPNMRESPSGIFEDFARGAIDAGVDIFHGHSAHIFQGVEIYKSKVILYDTGDFIDDYMVDPSLRNDRSFFFIVEAVKGKILSLRLFPVLIRNCQVNISKGKDRLETMERMEALSKKYGTSFSRDEAGLFTEVR